MDLLSLMLVGGVGAKINVRSSFPQRVPTLAWFQTQVLMVILITELSHYPNHLTTACGVI